MDLPSIFTYHCICSHLVLATTRDIFKLPRRQPPGLDGAIIVPLPPPPRSTDSDNESDENDDDDDEEEDNDGDGDQRNADQGERMDIDQRNLDGGPSQFASRQNHEAASSDMGLGGGGTLRPKDEPEPKDYTLLLSSIRDRRPCVIRREDGFEKRLLWRCGRCRLIFGYQIYDESLEELAKTDDEIRKEKKGHTSKNYFVYILPGGLTTAAGMGSLKEIDLQLVEEA